MAERVFLRAFVLMVVSVSPTSGYANETALRVLLRTGYDRYSRPAVPTNVTASYSLRSLKHLDITTESMLTTGFLALVWYDSRFVWNPSDYDNITTLDVNWSWRPEFIVTNSAGDVPVFGYDSDQTRMMVFSTGEVFWGVYFATETSCKIDTTDFPHDEQTCSIEISFANQNHEANLVVTLPNSGLDGTFFLENGEWLWTDSKYVPQVFTVCCPTFNIFSIQLTMTFTRRQSFYIVNILLPIVLLSFCVPWAFYINTDSGDRSGYALTMLLSYFVFLTVVSELIPSTSLNVPVLAEYLLTVLVLCTLALISVSIQVKLYFLETPPCNMARKIYRALRWLLKINCCGKTHVTRIRPIKGSKLKKSLPGDDERDCTSGLSTVLEEDITWKCITITLDRFFFYFYKLAVLFANLALVIALYS